MYVLLCLTLFRSFYSVATINTERHVLRQGTTTNIPGVPPGWPFESTPTTFDPNATTPSIVEEHAWSLVNASKRNGHATAFTTLVLDIVAWKPVIHTKPVLYAFTEAVFHALNNEILILPSDLEQKLADSLRTIKRWDGKTLQRNARAGAHMLRNKHGYFAEGVHRVQHLIDDVYNSTDDAKILFKAADHFARYRVNDESEPGAPIATKVGRNLFGAVMVPFKRIQGTPQERILISTLQSVLDEELSLATQIPYQEDNLAPGVGMRRMKPNLKNIMRHIILKHPEAYKKYSKRYKHHHNRKKKHKRRKRKKRINKKERHDTEGSEPSLQIPNFYETTTTTIVNLNKINPQLTSTPSGAPYKENKPPNIPSHTSAPTHKLIIDPIAYDIDKEYNTDLYKQYDADLYKEHKSETKKIVENKKPFSTSPTTVTVPKQIARNNIKANSRKRKSPNKEVTTKISKSNKQLITLLNPKSSPSNTLSLFSYKNYYEITDNPQKNLRAAKSKWVSAADHMVTYDSDYGIIKPKKPINVKNSTSLLDRIAAYIEHNAGHKKYTVSYHEYNTGSKNLFHSKSSRIIEPEAGHEITKKPEQNWYSIHVGRDTKNGRTRIKTKHKRKKPREFKRMLALSSDDNINNSYDNQTEKKHTLEEIKEVVGFSDESYVRESK